MQRIIDTSVQRLRCWAAVQQMAEAGAVWAQVWAILDGKTSPICREMHGRLIRVADAAAEVKYLSGLSPAAFEAQVGIADEAVVRREGLAGLQARNQLLPPYHPNCRTRVKLALEDPNPAPMPEGLSEDQQRAWRYWQEMGPAAQRFRLADAADAEWPDAKKEAEHALKHPELGGSLEAYRKSVNGVLENPKRMLFRKFADGTMQMALVGGGENDWRVAIIDPVARAASQAPTMRSAYGPKPGRPVPWSMKAKGMATRGWVEVEI
jgi:hypothetical protein